MFMHMLRRNDKSRTAFTEADPLDRMNPLYSTFHDKMETETTEKRSGADNYTDVGVQVVSSCLQLIPDNGLRGQ